MRFCGFEIGLDRTPLIVAGPCALESREMAMATAQRLAEICARAGAPFIFKASFDKANRTSGATARGWESIPVCAFWRRFASAWARRF